MSETWGGRNLIGVFFLLALASCTSKPTPPDTSLSAAETSAQAQDAASAPAISSIFFGASPAQGDPYLDTSPARGDTYELGETVVVFVQFDGPVKRTGDDLPQVALMIGAETQYATYTGGRNKDLYRFEYTVQEPDRDEDGISLPANAILLNGGAVTDPSGTVDADLTHGEVAADAGRKVNGSLASPPAVKRVYMFSSPTKGDIYGPGETVQVGVRFDRVVTVTGNPLMALTIGTQTRHAAFYGYGYYDDRVIAFSYGVQEGDRDEDGISIPANALILNGGTIALAADSTIDADLTHAAANADPTRKVSGSTDSP